MKSKSVYIFILTVFLSCNQKKQPNTIRNIIDTATDERPYRLDGLTLDSLNKGLYRYSESDNGCLRTLEAYTEYWLLDSLGKNGFREVFAQFILRKYNCVDNQWDIVSRYLGHPNATFISKNKRVYTYRLNYYSPDMYAIGTGLLDVEVDNSGRIIFFKLWEVDG